MGIRMLAKLFAQVLPHFLRHPEKCLLILIRDALCQHFFKSGNILLDLPVQVYCLLCQHDPLEPGILCHALPADQPVFLHQLQRHRHRRTADGKRLFDIPLKHIPTPVLVQIPDQVAVHSRQTVCVLVRCGIATPPCHHLFQPVYLQSQMPHRLPPFCAFPAPVISV